MILRRRLSRTLPWVDPLSVIAGLNRAEGALALLSDPGDARATSFIAAWPEEIQVFDRVEGPLFAALSEQNALEGVVGLASYDAGARAATGDRGGGWPDLILARYPSMLAFDHATGVIVAHGWAFDEDQARTNLDTAVSWLEQAVSPPAPPAPAVSLDSEASPDAYERAVADVVERIAGGELFQANIARAWSGVLHPEADPFDAFLRLARDHAAPFSAFWRIGDRALVSNSPELFLSLNADRSRIETRPIKGTRPRAADPQGDAAQVRALSESAKDRAENLMIVDLMRNDLSRVCRPGSVVVDRLFEVETYPTVHHLVSTVSGRPSPGVGPAEALEATFPPGSITGAPKHQAMRVIARHEPPRGPWCGSLFVIDPAGALTGSVLIRTAAFERRAGAWRVRAQAGAGIVADSDPQAELAETEAKIAALRQALTGSSADDHPVRPEPRPLVG